MPSYNGSSPTYAWGDDGSLLGFTSPATEAHHGGSGENSWIRFTGATALLASTQTITSATLTISGFNVSIETDEAVEFQGVSEEDSALPPDWATADALPTTGSAVTGNLNGLTAKDIDVTAIVEALRGGINGDVIQFRTLLSNYAGTAFTFTASLVVVYGATGPTGPGPVGSPLGVQKIVFNQQAVNRAAHY